MENFRMVILKKKLRKCDKVLFFRETLSNDDNSTEKVAKCEKGSF